MGINTGILQNATPLSSAAIKELERRVMENGEAFVYLDENNQLCFISAHTPEAIKDLAWNNAYELSAQDDKLIKKCFKKRSLRDYSLKDTLQKISFEDFWETYKAWRVLASDGKVPAECEVVNLLTEEMFLPGDALPELNNPFFILTVGDYDNDVSYGYLLLQKGFRSIEEARDYLALVCTLYGEEITSEDLANMDDMAWQQYKTLFPLLNTLDTGITENTFVPSEPTFFWGLFAIDAYSDKLDNLYCELFDLPVFIYRPWSLFKYRKSSYCNVA